MKRVQCDLFGKNESISFNILRLMELESLLKKPIVTAIANGFGLVELTSAFSVGMQHCKRRTPQWYAIEMQKLLEEGTYTYDEFVAPVLKAIIASGLLGKEAYYEAFPEERIETIKESKKAKNSKGA